MKLFVALGVIEGLLIAAASLQSLLAMAMLAAVWMAEGLTLTVIFVVDTVRHEDPLVTSERLWIGRGVFGAVFFFLGIIATVWSFWTASYFNLILTLVGAVLFFVPVFLLWEKVNRLRSIVAAYITKHGRLP